MFSLMLVVGSGIQKAMAIIMQELKEIISLQSHDKTFRGYP